MCLIHRPFIIQDILDKMTGPVAIFSGTGRYKQEKSLKNAIQVTIVPTSAGLVCGTFKVKIPATQTYQLEDDRDTVVESRIFLFQQQARG